VALLTGLSFNLKGNMSGEAVVGQNTFADIVEGRIEVDGQFTALFADATFRDYFLNETEVGLYVAVMATSSAAAADFIAFSLPRVKVGGAQPRRRREGAGLTCPFTAPCATPAAARPPRARTPRSAIQDSRNAFEYTPANAVALMRRFPWIREQVEGAAADRGKFLPASSTG
jgi:hypothetical protein